MIIVPGAVLNAPLVIQSQTPIYCSEGYLGPFVSNHTCKTITELGCMGGTMTALLYYNDGMLVYTIKVCVITVGILHR